MIRVFLASVVVPLAFVSAPVHAAEARHVRWTGKAATGRTLVVDEPDGAHPVLTLPPWATIDDLVVSPSREHALVYAQVHVGETRTVFVLDLVKRVVEGTYKPGFGGQLFFTAKDEVFQYWGCGTQCAQLTVRTRTGTQLFSSTCASFDESQEFSTDRRFLVCFRDSSGLDVIDVDRGKALFSVAATPCMGANHDDVKIDSKNARVSFTCDDRDDRRHAVTVWFGAVQRVVSRVLP